MNILDYCLKIDNVVPDEICDEYIRLFEDSDKKQRLDRGGYPNWTNLFIGTHHKVAEKKILSLSQTIALKYQEYLGEYGKHFNTNTFTLEGSNIKRYIGGSTDKYDTHADVASYDTSLRYVAFIYYLNDDFEGGETVFYPDVSIKPKKGSVLLFPPYWMFPHRGNPVIKGKKYILSTYCLWSPDEQN